MINGLRENILTYHERALNAEDSRNDLIEVVKTQRLYINRVINVLCGKQDKGRDPDDDFLS
jgi:hypothetical protein